jgi:hypothetical protein
MDWNIEGIAKHVMAKMQEENANIADIDFFLDNAFRSVQSREPAKATLVIEQVREFIEENYEE